MPRPDQPPRVEYKAQQGTPDQLPQGEAQQLNEAVAAIPEEGEVAAPEAQIELAAPADYEPQFSPETDDDVFITGPSTRPNEDVTAGAMHSQRVPESLIRSLPVLSEAAARPGAPDNLKLLVALLTREANRG